ncbi:MAG: hypothetical protein JWO76_1457 [Nocardioides sp.]|nr:hypothetical protein [Nocardioides sp.]
MKPNRLRTVLPVAVSLTCGLSAGIVMFVLPGEAAPAQLTYSAEATGEVWRINKLDVDMSGDLTSPGLSVGQASGLTGSGSTPRSTARGTNLQGTPAPSGQRVALSEASSTHDTTGTTTAAGAAGTVPQTIDYKSATMTARGRWVGDLSCVDSSTPLSASKVTVGGAGVVPAAIPEGSAGLPIPLPTEIPTDFPTEAPSGFPTGIPTDLPSPTIPTTLPPLPSLTPPTGLPTGLPTLPLPAARSGQSAADDVPMATLNAAAVEEKTSLRDWGTSGLKQVVAEATGTVTTPSAPAMTFFGGEVELRLASAPRLTAYSTGTANGSQVEWTPPQMTITVDGEPYVVPSDGTALAVQYSKNEDVVLTVSAGRLTTAESADGTLAQAEVSALDILIKNGDEVALDADLFPMKVKAVAPTDGVRCPKPPAPPSEPQVKLKGRGNGAKADKLTVQAATPARGAKTLAFKVVKGKRKLVASARLNAKGDHAFTLEDKNGKKPTTYLVKVRPTDRTTAGQASRRIR